jgi:peroxiredoxin
MTTTSVIAVRTVRGLLLTAALLAATGCSRTEAPRLGEAGTPTEKQAVRRTADSPEPRVARGTSGEPTVMPGEKEYREFKDNVKSNWKTGEGLDVSFLDGDGKPVDLKQYRGKKNVVLIMTRGYAGMVCPYCTAQTSRLIANIDEFNRRDAQVLAVWPGATAHVQDFVQAVQSQLTQKKPIPFPLWLDENFKAVDALGIRGELARPSTYILDKSGKVRFAYVGSNLTDRPSVKSMIEQLDAIAKN